jgi:hypothetical protein
MDAFTGLWEVLGLVCHPNPNDDERLEVGMTDWDEQDQAVAGRPAALGFVATEEVRNFSAMPAAMRAISALP